MGGNPLRKKILVTGSSGMVGGYLKKELSETNTDIWYANRANSGPAGLSDFYNQIVAFRPYAVIHLGAETNVDLCEKDPSLAYRSNVLLTSWISRACEAVNAKMVYVSSSSVFGKDEKFLYDELNSPHPVSVYAASKLKGEEAICTLCFKNFVIVRAGWMIGGGKEIDKKFVGSLIRQIKAGHSEIQAVSDKWGSITHAADLARLLVWSLSDEGFGLYHYACTGVVSRHSMAETVIEAFAATNRPSLRSLTSAHFPLAAPRPFSDAIESVRSSELPALLQPREWKSVLLNYVRELA